MKQIREGIFETNSSSTHSMVIRKGTGTYYTHEEMLYEMYDIHDGVYQPWSSLYFGRAPFRVLTTFEDKVRYAYANLAQEMVDEVIRELLPEFTRSDFKCHNCDIGTDDRMLESWLKEAGITLKEFLTNRKYIIICDGDEYGYWEALITAKLINTDVIERELTTYLGEYQDEADPKWNF